VSVTSPARTGVAHVVQTLGRSAVCTAFGRVLQSLIVGPSDLYFNPQYPEFAPHILEPVECLCIAFKELDPIP